MNVVAIVPARSGSERIPRKNFELLHGLSLLSRATRVAVEAGLRTVVTTDIPLEARDHVCESVEVLQRPSNLSRSDTRIEDVVTHTSLELQLVDQDHVLLLQPTSPLRTSNSLRTFLDSFASGSSQCESAFSVTEDSGDFWLTSEDQQIRRLRDFLPEAYRPRRSQERLPLLRENGLFYISSLGFLRLHQSFVNALSRPIITPIEEDLDINEWHEWRIAESLLESNNAAKLLLEDESKQE